jgi:hypothetical protein
VSLAPTGVCGFFQTGRPMAAQDMLLDDLEVLRYNPTLPLAAARLPDILTARYPSG